MPARHWRGHESSGWRWKPYTDAEVGGLVETAQLSGSDNAAASDACIGGGHLRAILLVELRHPTIARFQVGGGRPGS
jgi:hypothetical protein